MRSQRQRQGHGQKGARAHSGGPRGPLGDGASRPGDRPPPPSPGGPLACQLDVHAAVQQQVLGLQVPVDDVVAVAVLHGGQNLPEFLPCFVLAEVPVGGQII